MDVILRIGQILEEVLFSGENREPNYYEVVWVFHPPLKENPFGPLVYANVQNLSTGKIIRYDEDNMFLIQPIEEA